MTDPRLLGAPPPPIRRDRMVQAWIAAATVSWLGTQAWNVAVAWTAARTLPAGQAGLVLGIEMAPQALLTLLGGVLADRLDTRRVMVTTDLLAAATLCAGALAWGRLPALWVLLGAGIVFGCLAGLGQPAAMTLSRRLVATESLPTVSGWNQVAHRLAQLAGAPLGAWVVSRWGLRTMMLADAASFLVAAAAMASWVRMRYALGGEADEAPDDWRASLRAGWAYLRRDRPALALVVALCGLNVFPAPVMGLGIPLRIAASGWGADRYGLVEALASGAAIVGTVLAIRLRPGRPALSSFRLLVLQGACLGLVAVPSFGCLVAAAVTVGVTAGVVSVWLSAEFARVVDPAHLGRVASITTLGDLALIPVVTPAFGALTGAVGISHSPAVPAAAMVLLCVVLATRPEIRRLAPPASPATGGQVSG